MKSDIDVKELWIKQTVPAISQVELFKKIENFKRQRKRRAIILNAILLFTIFFVLFIWVYFQPQLMSTKIGIVLTVLSIGIVCVFHFRLFAVYKKADENVSNLDYINNLLVIKNKEYFMQTKIMASYFILLFVGIGLYMYEYTLGRSVIFSVVAYLALFVWVVINWFLLRPGIIKNNRQNIDDLLKQMERIKSQLDEL